MAKVKGIITIQPTHLTSKIGVIIPVEHALLRKWLFSSDRAVQQEILQAIVDTNKLADPPTEFELQMTLEFLESGLRTSHPNFRKECLVQIKWLIERIRKAFEKDFLLMDQGKPPKKNLGVLPQYIVRMMNTLYAQLMPDLGFELANPVLETLKLM